MDDQQIGKGTIAQAVRNIGILLHAVNVIVINNRLQTEHSLFELREALTVVE
jgi:hypothetical protein